MMERYEHDIIFAEDVDSGQSYMVTVNGMMIQPVRYADRTHGVAYAFFLQSGNDPLVVGDNYTFIEYAGEVEIWRIA